MLRCFLNVLTVLVFMAPSLVVAEMAPQFKESSKGKADLSTSAPAHGQVFQSKTTLKKSAQHNAVSKNKQGLERNAANQKQSQKIMQGTVNE